MAEKAASVERTLFELNRDARAALLQGDFAAALEKLRAALSLEPDSPALWLNYASAYRRAADMPQALAAVTEALIREPRNFSALLLKGALLEEAGRLVEAGHTYGLALLFKPSVVLDGPTQDAVGRAETLNARYRADLAAAIDQSVQALGAKASMSQSSRRFVDNVAGRAKIFTPQPLEFNIPGLPSQQFFDRELFPWLETYEQCAEAILQELQAARCSRPDLFEPYINMDKSQPVDQWAELNGSEQWSALHVIRHGEVCAYSKALFPETLEALSLLPQPDAPGRTPNAMFSALQPRTRIPAHTGVTNARLVTHLPLIVPPGCGFRVGSEIREWEVGQAWVFDDTIEHDAWNDGDELRIILIADIWNIFMSETDRAVYRAVLKGIDRHHERARDHDL